MPSVLSPYALTTLDELKEMLKITNDAQDNFLERLINRSTSRMEGRTARKLKKRTGIVETQDGNGTSILRLNEWPIHGAIDLRVDSDRAFGTDTIVDPTTYIVNQDNGIVKLVSVIIDRYTVFPLDRGNVRATYDGGYDPVPDDLNYACLETAMAYFARHRQGAPGIANESGGGYAVTWIDGLPETVVQILDETYMRK